MTQLVGPFPDALNPPWPPQSACTKLATSLNFPKPVSADHFEIAACLEGIREKISDVNNVPTPAEHDLARNRAVLEL